MNELQIFDNPEFGKIRTVERDGEPWFVGKDVAAALGYNDTNKAIAMHVDDEDKLNDKTASSLGQRGGWIINESGLYSLVLSSKLPTVRKFKRWVTNEVIPTIRKHKAYMTPDKLEEVLLNPDTLIQLAQNLKSEQEARRAAEAKIEADRPKVLFADAVSTSEQSILIGQLAKIIRQNGVPMGERRLFQWMRENGYLGKHGSRYNIPTQRSMEMGLFEIKETAVTHSDGRVTTNTTPKVTGKGQIYFVNCFLA